MRNSDTKVPVNLSLEDFMSLASRKPTLDGDWIYRLEQTMTGEETETPYPIMELGDTYTYFFRTLKDAEEFMKGQDNTSCIYRNYITQIPLGRESGLAGASWLYDGEGQLLDVNITMIEGSWSDMHFFGRPSNRQRFKKGEIVELFDGESAQLALLISTPPDVEWCHDCYLRCLNEAPAMHYFLDYSDDSCVVLEGSDYGWHSHPSTLMLMKPRYPIPKDLETEIRTWADKAEQQAIAEMNKQNEHPLQHS